MVNEYQIKEQICDIGKRIYARGMVAANDGNISVRLNDHEFLCTPTGVSKGYMTPESICKINEKGELIEACGKYRPSSEMKMHMRVYEKRPDVNAVVHAHPPYATSFAIQEFLLISRFLQRRLYSLAACQLHPMQRLQRERFRTALKSTFPILMRFFSRCTEPLPIRQTL